MPSGETPKGLREEVRFFEVRIMALRREEEELLRVERRASWGDRVLGAVPTVLGVVLWIAATGSALMLLWFFLLMFRMPR